MATITNAGLVYTPARCQALRAFNLALGMAVTRSDLCDHLRPLRETSISRKVHKGLAKRAKDMTQDMTTLVSTPTTSRLWVTSVSGKESTLACLEAND